MRELRRRVDAAKEARLESVRTPDALPAAVAKLVDAIKKSERDEGVRSVGVVVNRVRTARETYRALQAAGYRTFLITDACAPFDRVETLDGMGPGRRPRRANEMGDALTVVVATQAIEVGADFSFRRDDYRMAPR